MTNYLHNYNWESDNLKCCGPLILVKDQSDLLLNQVGILKIDEFDSYVMELKDALFLEWEPSSKEAIEDAIRKLVGKRTMTHDDLSILQTSLEAKLGVEFASKIGAPLYEFHLKSYTTAQEQILAMTPSFNLVDKKALKVLNQHNIYWVGENYGNNLYKSVQKIGNDIITQGLSKTEAGRLFEAELADKFQKYGSQYWEGFANHVVTRSREMGRVEGYVKAGIVRYEWVSVMDDRTSPICIEMNGRVFEVAKAVDIRDAIINADSPEDVKDIAPWRTPEKIAADAGVNSMSEISDEDIPADIILPPAHFRCRSRTVVSEG